MLFVRPGLRNGECPSKFGSKNQNLVAEVTVSHTREALHPVSNRAWTLHSDPDFVDPGRRTLGRPSWAEGRNQRNDCSGLDGGYSTVPCHEAVDNFGILSFFN